MGDHPFKPTVTPGEDWPSFVQQLWAYISPFCIEGVSVDQYAFTLQDHFTSEEWETIYLETLESQTDHEARSEAAQGIISRYTRYCYSFESRIRDHDKFLRMGDRNRYAHAILRYHKLLCALCANHDYYHYFALLEVLRAWNQEDRLDFLQRNGCINSFRAPIYEKITLETVKTALASLNLDHYGRTPKRSSSTASEVWADSKKPRSAVERRSSSSNPKVTCETDKYTVAFGNWRTWRKARAIAELINGAWLIKSPARYHQPFELPVKGRFLLITTRERSFRREQQLCPDCGNHPASDSRPCVLHPLYKDVQRDDNACLGKEMHQLSKDFSIATISTTTVEDPREEMEGAGLSEPSALESAFPRKYRNYHVGEQIQQHHKLTTGAELYAPSGEWLKLTVAIDSHSTISFVSPKFIEENNLDAFLVAPPVSITIKGHLHEARSVPERALRVRLRFGDDITDTLAYVVDDLGASELVLGMSWIDMHEVGLPRDANHETPTSCLIKRTISKEVAVMNLRT
ncbi:hypothetical protein DV495_001654 [Geotrichum candidum]|nr:hypothetical protein DV495_001654 [Geotrichum candidum]KAI8131764.1 hypothetical protein DUD61_004587 [Geotrichum candidum]